MNLSGAFLFCLVWVCAHCDDVPSSYEYEIPQNSYYGIKSLPVSYLHTSLQYRFPYKQSIIPYSPYYSYGYPPFSYLVPEQPAEGKYESNNWSGSQDPNNMDYCSTCRQMCNTAVTEYHEVTGDLNHEIEEESTFLAASQNNHLGGYPEPNMATDTGHPFSLYDGAFVTDFPNLNGNHVDSETKFHTNMDQTSDSEDFALDQLSSSRQLKDDHCEALKASGVAICTLGLEVCKLLRFYYFPNCQYNCYRCTYSPPFPGCESTTVGQGLGGSCKFPFIHNRVLYTGCAPAIGSATGNQSWCSTMTDYRGHHVGTPENHLGTHFGACPNTCTEALAGKSYQLH